MNTLDFLNTLEEIKATLERLSRTEREEVAAFASEIVHRDERVRVDEAAPAYRASARALSVDEYLEIERSTEKRHEYINGQMYPMSGSTCRHSAITVNVASALHAHLRGGPCHVYMTHIKLRLNINAEEVFYYPDIVVACGERDLDQDHVRVPRLIVEVLSPSTEATDRREKLFNYKQIPGVEECVLVAQRDYQVILYRRDEQWAPTVCDSLYAVAELRSIGLSLPLTQIYENAL